MLFKIYPIHIRHPVVPNTFVHVSEHDFLKTHLSIVTFSKIVSQIVFDVFRKLILEFWIQLEHFHESGNIDAFEITVGKGFDITA